MSGDRYKITDQNALYYLTLTVVDWVDVFTRKEYRYEIIDSLNYCIKEKGLLVYAWCLMSNHLHIIAKAKEEYKISDILRDFKKYTAKQIIKQIKEIPESREKWLLDRFEFAGRKIKRVSKYKFWKDDNHAIQLEDSEIIHQKVDYIHNNPVEAEIVIEPHEYIYSSAKFYADEPTLVKCERI